MRESVIYQEWQKEFMEKGRLEGREAGLKEGLKEGLEKGRLEAMEQVALNLLLSGMAVEQIASITGLAIAKIQKLGEKSE